MRIDVAVVVTVLPMVLDSNVEVLYSNWLIQLLLFFVNKFINNHTQTRPHKF